MPLVSQFHREFIPVLVADSNQTRSSLMCSALRRQPRFRITSCPAAVSDCVAALESTSTEVVLIGDVGRDVSQSYEILRRLHASYPHTSLILLVDRYDADLVVNTFRYGARGIFCSADQPFKALCRCIYAVHQGQIWANSEQIRYVLDALASAPIMHVVNAKGEGVLTAREDQVVKLVAEGISNREIAQQLSVKENTVKKSLLRIYDKLGVSNRVELVLYALTHSGKYHGETAQTRPVGRTASGWPTSGYSLAAAAAQGTSKAG
jgi:DNA-binding NarL/FixJ family response regulator